MVGLLAVVCYERTLDGRRFRLRLRAPLSGAVEELPDHISLVLFVLFMLSSTTYDGIKDTGLWQSIYWTNLLNLLQPLWDGDLAKAQALLEPGNEVYQRGGLLLSPFLYAAVYQAVMAVTRFATNGALSIKTLALNFAFSVIPIAVVYNFAHYYTVLLNIVTPFAVYSVRSVRPRLEPVGTDSDDRAATARHGRDLEYRGRSHSRRASCERLCRPRHRSAGVPIAAYRAPQRNSAVVPDGRVHILWPFRPLAAASHSLVGVRIVGGLTC
jgi:hypothetical protein